MADLRNEKHGTLVHDVLVFSILILLGTPLNLSMMFQGVCFSLNLFRAGSSFVEGGKLLTFDWKQSRVEWGSASLRKCCSDVPDFEKHLEECLHLPCNACVKGLVEIC